MSGLLSEIYLALDALHQEYAVAKSAGDEARLAILDGLFERLQALEADVVVRRADETRAALREATRRLEGVTRDLARLRQPRGTSAESQRPDPIVASMDSPEPHPEGGPSTFVAARKTGTKVILYTDSEGRDFVRIGGSRSWRNNNPGNIRKGDFSLNAGAIGDDGSFAIFPSEQIGVGAIVTLLRGRAYGPLSLEKAIARYAPASENSTEEYLSFVVSRTGIAAIAVLDDLSASDIDKIVDAIRAMEGWTPGEERAHIPASRLAAPAVGGISSAVGAAAEWMDIAWQEARLPRAARTAVPGPGDNPRILEYFRVGTGGWNPPQGDDTHWCAAFVNYCLEMSGYVGTNHPGARSFFWNKKGQFIVLPGPRLNAIAVQRKAPFTDDKWTTGPGHVGFVTGYTNSDVTLLGGNQGGTVKEWPYPLVIKDGSAIRAKFVAFLMPAMN